LTTATRGGIVHVAAAVAVAVVEGHLVVERSAAEHHDVERVVLVQAPGIVAACLGNRSTERRT